MSLFFLKKTAESELDAIEATDDKGIHDYILCILVRELFTFEQLKSITRSGRSEIACTKKGVLLRLQGHPQDKITVELDYTQSKAPRLFIFDLKQFANLQTRFKFSATGEILPEVVDVSD